MNFILRIFLLIGIIIYFLILLKLLRAKRLNLKYTLWWIFEGLIMLIMIIFPKFLFFLANFIGVVEPLNALFSLFIFSIIVMLMQISSILSNLDEKNKRLIQEYALLEKRINELENID